MATNLDIIKRAMKKLHVLPSGQDPTSAQASDGMDALQSLIVELIGQGSLGRLNDVLATSDYEAREWERVTHTSSQTITLPTEISASSCAYDYGFSGGYPDYAVSNNYSGTRPPMDRAPIVTINKTTNVARYNIYRAYTGEWVEVLDLDDQDDFPLADYLEDGFAALLAERMVDDYDGTLGAETKRQANACRMMLATKPDSQSRNTASRAQFM